MKSLQLGAGKGGKWWSYIEHMAELIFIIQPGNKDYGRLLSLLVMAIDILN